MDEFVLIAGMLFVTLSVRYPMLAFSNRIVLPDWFLQLLRYVPPTVLTAIVVPAVLMPTGNTLLLSFTNARLIGAIVAVVVGFRWQNLLLTIVLGMAAFLIWQGVLTWFKLL